MTLKVDGRADPVAQYLRALEEGNARLLEKVWPGQVVVYDPLVGEVQGHRELRHFVTRNRAWLADHGARTETVAAIRVGRRAVVELLATLGKRGWPGHVADRCGGRLHRRPFGDLPHVLQHACPSTGSAICGLPSSNPAVSIPMTSSAATGRPSKPGSADEIVGDVPPRWLLSRAHRPRCPPSRSGCTAHLLPRLLQHRGHHARTVRPDRRWPAVRRGIQLPALGLADLPPQAGLAVFERGADELLAAVRVYDDVVRPSTPSSTLPG